MQLFFIIKVWIMDIDTVLGAAEHAAEPKARRHHSGSLSGVYPGGLFSGSKKTQPSGSQ